MDYYILSIFFPTVERAWGLRTSDGTWDPKGYEESLRYLGEYCTENGPFDGLLGFSQGVDVATILSTLPTYSKVLYGQKKI